MLIVGSGAWLHLDGVCICKQVAKFYSTVQLLLAGIFYSCWTLFKFVCTASRKKPRLVLLGKVSPAMKALSAFCDVKYDNLGDIVLVSLTE